ncbi:MAG TPA: hypothetical protein VJ550_11530 [Geomonas sp.]|nr:hypothetical protein [Geomonas sp.]
MKKNVVAALLGSALLASVNCQATDWVKNNVDVPNKNLEANYYDGDSVKAHDKTISWTEKYVLTPFGVEQYNKHLASFPVCKQNIASKGQVTYHQMDFEIKEGKFRVVAKRNYNKKDELVCTDKDMNKELDTSWHKVVYRSPMYERYYILVTKYKLGNL